MRLITYSELRTLFQCPKQHDFRYNRGLRPRRKSTALGESSKAHDAVEIFYKGGTPEEAIKVFDDVDDETLLDSRPEAQQKFMRMKALLTAYFQTRGKWDRDQYEFTHVEKEFNIPIDFEGIGAVEGVNFAGKIDGIWKSKDRNLLQVVEHKFLAQFSENRNTLMMDLQVSLYAVAAREVFGVKVPVTLYNVVKKPAHRLKQGESLDEFYERVLGEVLKAPDKYFLRLPVTRGKKDFDEAKKVLVHGARILSGETPLPFTYRNVGMSCTMGCSYLDICMDESPGLVDHLFEVTKDRHQELQQEDIILKGGSK